MGEGHALDLPIACFTEWSLGESLPHTAEYGRIGLGFPKRWVIERGGQSVTYLRHNGVQRLLLKKKPPPPSNSTTTTMISRVSVDIVEP